VKLAVVGPHHEHLRSPKKPSVAHSLTTDLNYVTSAATQGEGLDLEHGLTRHGVEVEPTTARGDRGDDPLLEEESRGVYGIECENDWSPLPKEGTCMYRGLRRFPGVGEDFSSPDLTPEVTFSSSHHSVC
jgi:hypothetical protein